MSESESAAAECGEVNGSVGVGGASTHAAIHDEGFGSVSSRFEKKEEKKNH